MGAYEVADIGIKFSNINDNYQNYTFSWCLIMMSISGFMFLIIGLYLDNVVPSAFGRQKPWYFCVSPTFWRGYKKSNKTRIDNKESSNHSLENEAYSNNQFELKYLKP